MVMPPRTIATTIGLFSNNMIRRMRVLVAVLAPSLALMAFGGADMVLCGEGAPAGRAIVLPRETSASVRYAARELASYLEQITGKRMPVVDELCSEPPCAIRLVPDERLGSDGFHLLAEPPNLKIIGSAKRGILYGVYELLETYGGVGWYAADCTVIPKAKSFVVPATLDHTERPAFAVREPAWYGVQHDADFAARLRLNGESMRPEARHGGNEFRFGGGLSNSHTLPLLVPADEFFETHPEYFAEVGGQRIRDGQLCLSNPDVLRIVTERVLDRIRRDPEATYFGVSQRDTLGYCECSECAAVDAAADSHAGSVIKFVNAVAEAVEKEFPGKIIETLAYQYSRKPPKGLHPRANVMPCLCSIECDFKEPLVRSGYPENAALVNDLKGWGALTDRLYVWDYTTDFRQYQLPFPNIGSMQPNMRLFREAGVTTVFSEGAYNTTHSEFEELKTWLLSKLMWNPEQETDALIDRFLAGYYGPAAAQVRRYYDALTALPRDTAKNPLKSFQDIDDPVLTDEFLEQSLGFWNEAVSAAKGNADALAHVKAGALPVVYTMLLRRGRHGVKHVWVSRHPERFGSDRLTPKLLAFFEKEYAALGSPRLSELDRHHQESMAVIRELSTAQINPIPADCVLIEETALDLSRPGVNGSLVDDPQAGNGRAIRLGNDHHLWCVVLKLWRVAYDPDVTYRLRARVRVEKGGEDGKVFGCGVYDEAAEASCGSLEPTRDQVGDGYRWYDILEWKPKDSQYIWFAPGWFAGSGPSSAHQGVFLDCLELSRSEVLNVPTGGIVIESTH